MTTVERKRRRAAHRIYGRPLVAFALIAPTVAYLGLLIFYPIASSINLSFFRWPGIGRREFVGFGNYIEAFSDTTVHRAFLNNVLYTIGILAVAVIPGLLLAAALAGGIKGRTVYQTVFFFPRLLSQVIVSVLWSWIYNPNFGLLNTLLRHLGLNRLALGWLGHPTWALPSVVVAAGWTYFGFCMVIFLAALQSTSQDLNDAAIIDGAGAVQTFFNVTVPQIRTVITMVIMYTIIDSFKVFDIIYMMTRGGPGDRTQIMATYLYRESFRHSRFGYGATIAVLLTVFVVTVAVLFQRIREREDRRWR